MRVVISVQTPDRGDLEVQKHLPDNYSLTSLTSHEDIQELIQATADQAMLAYPTGATS